MSEIQTLFQKHVVYLRITKGPVLGDLEFYDFAIENVFMHVLHAQIYLTNVSRRIKLNNEAGLKILDFKAWITLGHWYWHYCDVRFCAQLYKSCKRIFAYCISSAKFRYAIDH